MNPLLITTPTSLQDDFLISVLAATITLTPGTVTVGRQDNSLIILWLNPTTTDPDEAALKIFRRTELLLSKLQRSM
jgi:multicomponent Na+:H+ antiporter subunit E